MHRRSLSAALAGLLFASTASAHDYWLDADGADYLLYRGHRFSQHKGEATVPYDPAIVTRVLCLSASGQVNRLMPAQVYPLRIAGPCAAVLVEADSGHWTQALLGTQNKPRTEVTGALRSWRAIEGVKLIDSWVPSLQRPLSDGLELVSSDDPLRLRPGDKLRLQVTWKGRPREGVAVAYDGSTRGMTGSDGRINIRLRHGGTQFISASIDEPADDSVDEPGIDKLVRSAALIFELPGGRQP
jgi:nickel transport protein